MNNRTGFSSKTGFILATAGASVGLGNLWRFPYLAAQYGGGLFVFIYIILVFTIGSVLLITEITLGRHAQCDVFDCYRTLDKRFTLLGIMGLIIPILIASSYSVIGGWIIKYFLMFLRGHGEQLSDKTYFSEYITLSASPLLYHAGFLLLSFLILLSGIKNGIEKSNKILMPLLFLISIIISIKVILLPGALEGIKFYLIPDFSNFSLKTLLAAIGQMFYSLSIAMGVMITYGSYLNRDIQIPQSAKMAEIFDTVIAILGGLMIVPAVFVFSGGDKNAIPAGPGLLFETLPKIFHGMTFGNFFGALFFLLILFAALTSMISLMEVLIAFFADRFALKRFTATTLTALIIFTVGTPSSLGFGVWKNIKPFGMAIFDFLDYVANSFFMPLIAIFTCIFVGYFLGTDKIFHEAELSAPFRHKKYYTIMIKYIVPICIGAVWISTVFHIG